jgi:hypothetical protein
MADSISPINNEPIVDPNTGYPTRRFYAWLTNNNTVSNDANTITETQSHLLSSTLTAVAIDEIAKANQEMMILVVTQAGEIGELKKEIEDLKVNIYGG